MKKKVFLIIISVFLLSVGYIVYLNHSRVDDEGQKIYKTLNNTAKEQTISNLDSDIKSIKISNTGIYEVTTISDEDSNLTYENPKIPPLNEKITGVYISKGEQFDIPKGVVIKFVPVKFDKLGEKDNFTLDTMGKYYIGGEISPGKYKIKDNTSKDSNNNGEVQLVIDDSTNEMKVIKFNVKQNQQVINLEKGSFLSIKSPFLKVDLKFEKIT